jgi:hypothetical protein
MTITVKNTLYAPLREPFVSFDANGDPSFPTFCEATRAAPRFASIPFPAAPVTMSFAGHLSSRGPKPAAGQPFLAARATLSL